ncbi:uncharacterized protein LOC106717709 [Papilio machaon]|uniref:uncharacterized protein LOC106717709 n=1 Tax=Papilio machaon TaxID=76193 RepID=UPI001E663ECB|nr:uncharacterized protein LOC106717709 [Papilio machaon]
MDTEILKTSSTVKTITEKDVKLIVKSYLLNTNAIIENYVIHNASDKMLGFLSDYWKLKVQLLVKEERKLLSFFIKAISTTNEAKANMVKELKLFDKELFFYNVIKRQLEISGMKPWSASLIRALPEAMVFDDLNTKGYQTKNKFERFDKEHTLQALNTLARFHASSIIYEERKSKSLMRKYRINEEFENYLNRGGYKISDPWYYQCMTGALEAVKKYSKYNNDKEMMDKIDKQWREVWQAALKLSDSTNQRCVICHRDLWNNNILFRYKDVPNSEPDDCVLVDFQAVRYQEPAGDVMLLLYCNLDPSYRENKVYFFLNYYYEQLKRILFEKGIQINDVLRKEMFLASAEEQRLWGLVVSACLIPQFWLNDSLTTKTFGDTENFNQILSKNKGAFIIKMMATNQDYKGTVMSVFDEIVERYCVK